MLIDATHAEETRVVVVDGTKVEDFDFESLNKRQLAGNIYLAKVTRVEPSLQAAFVDYGGNRHGFLAFSEIHPDYYQIPKADREALLAEEAALAREAEEEAAREKPKPRGRSRSRKRAAAAAEAAAADATRSSPRSRSPRSTPPRRRGARGRAAAVGRRRRHRHRRARRADAAAAEAAVPADAAVEEDEEDEHARRGLRGRRRRRRPGGARAAQADAAAALQDPGGDQGPPDPAGAGRQGGARQQGRGADHLPRRSPAATAC